MSTQLRDHIPMRPVSIEVDGRKYTGSYALAGETVTAFWGVKERSRTTRGAPATNVARRLLRELVHTLSESALR
jgi:hypothetical protein